MLFSFSASSASVSAEPTSPSGDAADIRPDVPARAPGRPTSGLIGDSSPSKSAAFADLLAAAAPADPAASVSGVSGPGSEPVSSTSAPGEGAAESRPAPFRRFDSATASQPDANDAAVILAGMLAVPVPPPAASEPAATVDLCGEPPAAEDVGEEQVAVPPLFARAKGVYSATKADDTVEFAPRTDPDEVASVSAFAASAPDADVASQPAGASRETAPAVFADALSGRLDGHAGAIGSDQKNTSQDTAIQEKGNDGMSAGMEKAKKVGVMTSASAQLSSAALSRRAVEAVKPVASFAESAAGSSPATLAAGSSVSSGASPVVAETVPASTPLPAAAVRLIDRVEDVAERVEARAADNVRVSLDLDGNHRVEVKVALRGGRVFADFRTDSPEMRAALTEAWSGFVRGSEGASRRWADPVFSSLGSAPASVAEAPAPANQASGSFERDLSSRQDAATDQRQAPRREPAAEENGRPVFSASSGRVVSASPGSSARPDPSRLLSAVA